MSFRNNRKLAQATRDALYLHEIYGPPERYRRTVIFLRIIALIPVLLGLMMVSSSGGFNGGGIIAVPWLVVGVFITTALFLAINKLSDWVNK